MELRKIGIVLLSLLLAAMAMVPLVSAAENLQPEDQKHDNVDAVAQLQQAHHIPQEYFKDAKPADPLPESDMITLILSEKTLETFGQDKTTGTIRLPCHL